MDHLAHTWYRKAFLQEMWKTDCTHRAENGKNSNKRKMKMQGAVMEQADTISGSTHFYGSLKGMRKKFSRYARQDAFTGSTREDRKVGKSLEETLKELLGWKYIRTCDLDPRVESRGWRAFVGKK